MLLIQILIQPMISTIITQNDVLCWMHDTMSYSGFIKNKLQPSYISPTPLEDRLTQMTDSHRLGYVSQQPFIGKHIKLSITKPPCSIITGSVHREAEKTPAWNPLLISLVTME